MKYKKKPIEIEAIQWIDENKEKIKEWVGENFGQDKRSYYINTLEGPMIISDKDYIIKGINGEFYPCKPDIFEKSYDKI